MLKPSRYSWLLLILLAATFLRLHDLPEVPPGMTHDEADHGLDAWGVVQGDRPLYFTVGYGREPFFDYSTAVLMTFLGPSYLAGRLTAVYFSLILIVATYAWVRRAFDEPTALLTAAGLAVSFWPLMVARQALRTVTMPALFALAVYFFWKGVEVRKRPLISNLHSLISFSIAGLLLGVTFYTYMPARIMWLLFPAFLAYLLLLRRPVPWRGTLLMLLLMLLVATPLLLYLQAHPAAEVRLDQLAGPLKAAGELNFEPLFDNVRQSLLLFTVRGDTLWRYNVPGRPFLPWLMGLLFYGGLAVALFDIIRAWRQPKSRSYTRAPAHFLALAWLLGGLSPALVTGPEASMTRAAGMQPVLYLFPAIALTSMAALVRERIQIRRLWFLPLAALLLLTFLFANTFHTYFGTWATAEEVQIQYEDNLVSAIRLLNRQQPIAAAISTNEPNRFHDPAAAAMFLEPETVTPRWFDGRGSLLLPGADESTLLFTAEAPLHPALARYLSDGADVGLEPISATSAESGVTTYSINTLSTVKDIYPQFSPTMNNLSTELSTDVTLGDAVAFLGHALLTPQPQAGETVQLATLWQVKQRPAVDLVFFTHVLGPDGQPVAQADRLDVPSAYWIPGDFFIQLHEIELPADLVPGSYPLHVGAYDQDDWRQRLPRLLAGELTGDAISLPPLNIGS